MKCIKKVKKVVVDMNVWEISFFKLYLLAVGLIISYIIPQILIADLWVYLVMVLVSYALILSIMFSKQGNFYKVILKKWYTKARIFNKLDLFDIAAFKNSVFITWIVLAKIFPVLLSFCMIYVYIAIAFLWIGYIMNSLLRK